MGQKKGRFKLAHKDSIFLDELGELPVETQLLGVLQEQEFERVGASRAAAMTPETLPTMEEGERRLMLRALEQTGGVLAGPKGAAELWGVNRSTLWSRMRKLCIEGGGD